MLWLLCWVNRSGRKTKREAEEEEKEEGEKKERKRMQPITEKPEGKAKSCQWSVVVRWCPRYVCCLFACCYTTSKHIKGWKERLLKLFITTQTHNLQICKLCVCVITNKRSFEPFVFGTCFRTLAVILVSDFCYTTSLNPSPATPPPPPTPTTRHPLCRRATLTNN